MSLPMSLKVLIVEARFYEDLADALLAGARAVLEAHGARVEVISVPGALEIPAALSLADQACGFDGYVALGCVIRGETYHFEIVAGECARGLADLALHRGLAISNGVLTVEDEAQAWARAKPEAGDKGGAAARACLAMIALKDRFTRAPA